MDILNRVRTAVYSLGLLLYGPAICGLSAVAFKSSLDQSKSMFVLFIMAASLIFFALGCVIVVLTMWLGYELLVEYRLTKQGKNAQPLETVAQAAHGDP
jgi:hypothetical protein